MLKLKLQYFGCKMQKMDSLEKTVMPGKTESKKGRETQKMRWLDRSSDSMNMSLSTLQEIMKDEEAWPAAIHEVTKSWTRLSD